MRSFIFGTKQMPALDLTEEQLEKLASETVNQGLTVPGVQKNKKIFCLSWS